jgi:hypothetical protein
VHLDTLADRFCQEVVTKPATATLSHHQGGVDALSAPEMIEEFEQLAGGTSARTKRV